MAPKGAAEDFNVSIGHTLLALHKKDMKLFVSNIRSLRQQIARSMSAATTSSIGACHDTMLKCHVLTELEMIAGPKDAEEVERSKVLESLNRRLEVIGAYLDDKQYLLGIRRAAMQLSRYVDVSSSSHSLLLTRTASDLRKMMLHLLGLQVHALQEKAMLSTSPSTPYFMRHNLEMNRPQLSMHDFYGRKDTIEKPYKAFKVPLKTTPLFHTTGMPKRQALLMLITRSSKTCLSQEHAFFWQNGRIVLDKHPR